MNLTLSEITGACKGELIQGGANPAITSVSTDSRTIERGAVFFAIHGPNFDGHAYIEAAREKGAVCAVIESPSGLRVRDDFPLVIVPSVQNALLDLAAYYRRLFTNVKVIAVTGSAGKTTTKDMIASVLGQQYKTKKTIGNFNNHIGLPLTLFSLNENDEAIVAELGMNHAGEISVLSQTAAPDIAVITNIGDAHIENFNDGREGILHAKLEILDGLKENGVFITNGDDPLLNNQKDAVLCHLDNALIEPQGIRGTKYKIGGQPVFIPLPGRHNVMNFLLAAKVGEMLGLNAEQIAKGIENFSPSGDRMEIIEANGMTIINDVYNANPAAMKAAISILSYAEGRKVCILGDMFELGLHAEDLHREVGRFASGEGVAVIAIGELAKYYEGTYYFTDKGAFLESWRNILKPGDTVLIKASNGMAFKDILKGLMA